MKNIVIIGGVAGGATLASRLRRKDEESNIAIFERGDYISFANCGLPYYIGNVIDQRSNLLLETPQAMKNKFNIDVKIKNEVIKIDKQNKQVKVKDLNTNEEYYQKYDKLIISTGSSPLRPPIEGIDNEKIFTLWNINDTDKIKSFINKNKPKKASVIGGGFIGLEMAENLAKQGIDVSIIEMQNQVMAPLDIEMANLLHEEILSKGVNLILNDGVKSFKEENGQLKINLQSGKEEQSDMVLLSIGVRPNSMLAKDAGLELNKRGGIVVNEHMETSQSDIYALGDVIEVTNFISKEKTMIPLAGPANKQARILADYLTGEDKQYSGSMGTSIAQVFDLNAASTGLNEKQLKLMGEEKNKDYRTIIINQKSHAGYYPNASFLTLKLIFNNEGKILGCQMVGKEGVDKRIDVIATAIKLNATIYDLQNLELAYAPPFSSAKDPVNMLGYVAQNLLSGMVDFIEYDELDKMIEENKDNFTILDVTEDFERQMYKIEPSYHIPLGKLRTRLDELDKNKMIITYCKIGVRSYNAMRILKANGFKNVKVLSGGTDFYKSMHY